MFLRITGHTIVERLTRVLDRCTVGKESFVEALHLLNQFSRMGMTSWCRHKPAVLLGLITSEQKQVADTQKLQVEQFVFDIRDGGATTDDMRLNGNVVTLLDGGSDGYRTRTTTNPLPFKLSILQFLIYKLRVMRRDVDIGRIKLLQLVDIGKKLIGARPFQWGQHLEGKSSAVFI